MNGQLTFDDRAPDWPALEPQPGDHTPTRFDLRQDEMRDLRNQHVGPVALRTARTLNPPPEYL